MNGVVYVGSSDHFLYAFDARDGHQLCRFDTGGTVSASPLVADPDGGGLVVYAGDTALSGNDGGHIWAINAIDPNAAANCSKRWVFAGFDDPKAGVVVAAGLRQRRQRPQAGGGRQLQP